MKSNTKATEELKAEGEELVNDLKSFEILRSFGLDENDAFKMAIERPVKKKESVQKLLKFFS